MSSIDVGDGNLPNTTTTSTISTSTATITATNTSSGHCSSTGTSSMVDGGNNGINSSGTVGVKRGRPLKVKFGYDVGQSVDVIADGVHCAAIIIELIENYIPEAIEVEAIPTAAPSSSSAGATAGKKKASTTGVPAVKVHYIGWNSIFDEIITDFKRILPPFSGVQRVKVWGSLSEKFPLWPCIAYIRCPNANNKEGITYLETKEKLLFILPCLTKTMTYVAPTTQSTTPTPANGKTVKVKSEAPSSSSTTKGPLSRLPISEQASITEREEKIYKEFKLKDYDNGIWISPKFIRPFSVFFDNMSKLQTWLPKAFETNHCRYTLIEYLQMISFHCSMLKSHPLSADLTQLKFIGSFEKDIYESVIIQKKSLIQPPPGSTATTGKTNTIAGTKRAAPSSSSTTAGTDSTTTGATGRKGRGKVSATTSTRSSKSKSAFAVHEADKKIVSYETVYYPPPPPPALINSIPVPRNMNLSNSAIARIAAKFDTVLDKTGVRSAVSMPVKPIIDETSYHHANKKRKIYSYDASGALIEVPPSQPVPPASTTTTTVPTASSIRRSVRQAVQAEQAPAMTAERDGTNYIWAKKFPTLITAVQPGVTKMSHHHVTKVSGFAQALIKSFYEHEQIVEAQKLSLQQPKAAEQGTSSKAAGSSSSASKLAKTDSLSGSSSQGTSSTTGESSSSTSGVEVPMRKPTRLSEAEKEKEKSSASDIKFFSSICSKEILLDGRITSYLPMTRELTLQNEFMLNVVNDREKKRNMVSHSEEGIIDRGNVDKVSNELVSSVFALPRISTSNGVGGGNSSGGNSSSSAPVNPSTSIDHVEVVK